MTISTKTTVKTYFETGDFPTQQNFADLIDSFLGLGETASQTIQGPIVVSGAASFRTGAIVSGATGLYGDITFGTSAASTARTSMGLGTAAVLNTGVSANNIPKLDSQNRLPAVDGSLLTGINPGALVLVASAAASNVASVAFTSAFDSTYRHYIIEAIGFIPASNSSLCAQFYQNGSYLSASNYRHEITARYNGSDASASGSAQSRIVIGGLTADGSNTSPINAVLDVMNPSGNSNPSVFFKMWTTESSGASGIASFGTGMSMYQGSAGAVTGLKLFMSTGNISTGTVKIYGVI